MGEVISKNAAAEAIEADVEQTAEQAKARGGKWQALAEERLSNPLRLFQLLKDRIGEAAEQARPMGAQLDAQDDHADGLVGHISDEIWNKIGRPAFDPTYDVVFPNGIGYYTGGPDAEQPDRMELLAELLEMNIIGRIPPDEMKVYAQQVRDEAAAYRKLLAQVTVPRTRLQLLERARVALAHAAQMELVNLKRLYRTAGFSEAEIHSVIPDRPRRRVSAAVPPAPPPAAS
jgi:hypothetical protein